MVENNIGKSCLNFLSLFCKHTHTHTSRNNRCTIRRNPQLLGQTKDFCLHSQSLRWIWLKCGERIKMAFIFGDVKKAKQLTMKYVRKKFEQWSGARNENVNFIPRLSDLPINNIVINRWKNIHASWKFNYRRARRRRRGNSDFQKAG